MNRIRALAQVVGFVTMGLLALYGLLALFGVAGPLGLAVEADEAAIIQGDTIPQTMNYQGFLREPDGSLITDTVTITARIWDQATGGTVPLYETTVPNVTVRDGLFNIVLGDDPELAAEAFSETPRYIGISLDGAPELIPRQRLHAVPWALTSTTLVDHAPAQSVQGLSSSGDITLTDGSGIIVEGGDIDATGNLSVTGDVDATGNLNVTGDIDATGNLRLTGGMTVSDSLTVTGDMTVTGDFDVKRRYQTYYYYNTGSGGTETAMGSWDLCALLGTEVVGVGNGAADIATCAIRTGSMGANYWGSYGPYDFGPGARESWYLAGLAFADVNWVKCEAICFNLGE